MQKDGKDKDFCSESWRLNILPTFTLPAVQVPFKATLKDISTFLRAG